MVVFSVDVIHATCNVDIPVFFLLKIVQNLYAHVWVQFTFCIMSWEAIFLFECGTPIYSATYIISTCLPCSQIKFVHSLIVALHIVRPVNEIVAHFMILSQMPLLLINQSHFVMVHRMFNLLMLCPPWLLKR